MSLSKGEMLIDYWINMKRRKVFCYTLTNILSDKTQSFNTQNPLSFASLLLNGFHKRDTFFL